MKIETLEQLEDTKKTILEMKSQSTSEFVISVFQKMLDQLSVGDVENMYTPSFLSIQYFGYDIFEVLHRI
jgi:hypothetical protein